jgi:hypothetical protein
MPNEKLQQIALEFRIDLADISKKDAKDLCEYIQDYIVEHYNTINCDYKVIDGE